MSTPIIFWCRKFYREASLPLLPTLPERLKSKVFTHSSVHGLQNRKASSAEERDNERLAFLGDAVLQVGVAEHLYTQFPKLKIGDLTLLRSHVVSNSQLSSWATAYRFHDQLRSTIQDSQNLSERVRATAFEAYIGASQLCHGPEITHKWIRKLICSVPHLQNDVTFEGKISDLLENTSRSTFESCSQTPLNRINDTAVLFIEAARRKIPLQWSEFQETPQPSLSWRVSVTVVGNVFEGTAASIKDAKIKASTQALNALGWRDGDELVNDVPDGHYSPDPSTTRAFPSLLTQCGVLQAHHGVVSISQSPPPKPPRWRRILAGLDLDIV